MNESEVLELAENIRELSMQLTTCMNVFNTLSPSIGKLDMLIAYCAENYSKDNYLISSLESIFSDTLDCLGNNTYKRLKVSKNSISNTPERKFKPITGTQKQYKNNFDFNKSFIDFEFEDTKNIGKIRYISSLNNLNVTFKKNNEVYTYYNIPQSEVLKLCNAEFPDKYFGDNIRTKYRYEKLTEMVGA